MLEWSEGNETSPLTEAGTLVCRDPHLSVTTTSSDQTTGLSEQFQVCSISNLIYIYGSKNSQIVSTYWAQKSQKTWPY